MNYTQSIFYFLVLSFLACSTSRQTSNDDFNEIPQGKMEFELYYSEWGGRMPNGSCDVIIDGYQITVQQNEKTNLTGGKILAKGTLMKHQSGKWIIAEKEEDKFAEEIGDCTGGPVVVDLKKKIIEWC